MKKAVVFGGGNIGRSFITPVLQSGGYEITIVDLDEKLIDALNGQGEYTIKLCSNEGIETRTVSDYKALSLSMKSEIASALDEADIVSTSVGLKGFRNVCTLIAKALPLRRQEQNVRPLDFILAENIHGAASLCREHILDILGPGFPLDRVLGIIETSIGKMVPFITREDREKNPLCLRAEPYNTLILDKDGFLNIPPTSPDIRLVSPIHAYVDRKLYIHNIGHGATAYLGRLYHPELKMIWEVLEDERIRSTIRSVMVLSATALVKEYPGTFTLGDLEGHVDDLIQRFRNRALGDTVQRVGRDIKRKIAWNDRICGAMRLVLKHSLPLGKLPEVYRAASLFGLHCEAEIEDRTLSQHIKKKGLLWMFDEYSSSPYDDSLMKQVLLQR